IGNQLGDNTDDRTGGFTSSGGVTVTAGNHGYAGTFAIAGAKATSTPTGQAATTSAKPIPKTASGGTQGTNGTTRGDTDLAHWQSRMADVLAEMKSKNNPAGSAAAQAPAPVADAAKGVDKQGQSALTISGSIAVNVILDDTHAYVRNVATLDT